MLRCSAAACSSWQRSLLLIYSCSFAVLCLENKPFFSLLNQVTSVALRSTWEVKRSTRFSEVISNDYCFRSLPMFLTKSLRLFAFFLIFGGAVEEEEAGDLSGGNRSETVCNWSQIGGRTRGFGSVLSYLAALHWLPLKILCGNSCGCADLWDVSGISAARGPAGRPGVRGNRAPSPQSLRHPCRHRHRSPSCPDHHYDKIKPSSSPPLAQ